MSSRSNRWRVRKRADRAGIRENESSSESADDVEGPRRLRFRQDVLPNHNQGQAAGGDSDASDSSQERNLVDIIHDLNASGHESEGNDEVVHNVMDPNAEQEQRAQQVDANFLLRDDNIANVAEIGANVNGQEIEVANPNDGLVNENLSSDSEQPSESEEDGNEDEDSDEEEDDEGQAPMQPNDQPLYPGAQVTFGESLIAILTYVLTHHLTGNSLIDLLALIVLHCPVNSACVKSLHSFKRFFKKVGKDILVCHYYCSVCYQLLAQKDAPCPQCERVTKTSYFIEVPLLNQLQILFNRPGFYNALQFRFQRQKKHANNIEDIYDGAIYKEHVESGFLSQPNNISFMWYTDGVSVFNYSNKFSIWPLYLVINELRYKDRVKKENMILAGIWFGKTKPKPNTFLQPFYTKMEDFSRNGYLLHQSDGPPIRVRGVVLCGTCDMPAKSLFLRFKQFNGFYGCPKCLHKGEQYNDTTIHVYRYSPGIPSRRNADIELHGRVAVASGQPCYGVKGVSLLFRIVSDMVRSTGIDVMHGSFSGLGKSLLEWWFDKDYDGMPFSFLHVVDSVNARLAQFKVPSFLNKFPQSVCDLSSWKSLDYKVWLLYYSVPVLSGLMSDVYLNHHMLLVSALYILSQRSISLVQINQASAFLNKYVSEFQDLYHLRFMGINVHQLTHLAECVVDLGPVWVYSCYFLEDLNGKICKYIHGTSHVGSQIASATTYMQKLASFILLLNPISPARMYCDKVNKMGRNYKVAEVVSPGVHVIGKYCTLPVPPRGILHQHMNIQGGHCQLFSRLWSKGILFMAESYTRAAKRQSSFVLFTSDGNSCLGSIKYFIRWSDCNCISSCRCQPCSYLCVLQVFERVAWRPHFHPDNVAFSYLNAVRDTPEIVVIPVSNLLSLCFYLSINHGNENKQYIIDRVNYLEAE